MPISGIADYTGYDPDYVPETAGDELDNNDFLQLIIAQLTNQDPLEPLSSNEFMTQISVMGQLEQLQNMNANFEELILSQGIVYGSQLIGQTVQAIDKTTNTVVEGEVSAIAVNDGQVYIQVGEYTALLTDILAVNPWTSSSSILEASQMVGMKVTAYNPDDLLGYDTISGVVEEASIENSEVRLKFTDEDNGLEYEIGLEDIIAVSRPTSTEADSEG